MKYYYYYHLVRVPFDVGTKHKKNARCKLLYWDSCSCLCPCVRIRSFPFSALDSDCTSATICVQYFRGLEQKDECQAPETHCNNTNDNNKNNDNRKIMFYISLLFVWRSSHFDLCSIVRRFGYGQRPCQPAAVIRRKKERSIFRAFCCIAARWALPTKNVARALPTKPARFSLFFGPMHFYPSSTTSSILDGSIDCRL